ncbi:MAG: hypothetical protein HZC41_23115 [Chloroflexi bacterium]|nr:hypothetical protein [Chloroflexota bacterium]
MKRPGRPFGVAIAIAAGVFLFALLPLLQVGMALTVRQHFLNAASSDDTFAPLASGADFIGGVSTGQLALQSVLALAFLVVAVVTWRGRPPQMRFIYVGAVVLLTAIKFAAVLAQSAARPDVQAGVSSGDDLARTLTLGQFVIEFLVMLYVVWYLNRAPARAFFRGYFLPRPPDTAPPEATPSAAQVER